MDRLTNCRLVVIRSDLEHSPSGKPLAVCRAIAQDRSDPGKLYFVKQLNGVRELTYVEELWNLLPEIKPEIIVDLEKAEKVLTARRKTIWHAFPITCPQACGKYWICDCSGLVAETTWFTKDYSEVPEECRGHFCYLDPAHLKYVPLESNEVDWWTPVEAPSAPPKK